MPRRRMLIDVAPFRESRDFRWLWGGYLASNLGNQGTIVAVAYEVYRISRSTLDVGLVSLVQLVPLLLGAFAGGAIADRVDRRKLLVCSQLLLCSTSLGLALNALAPRPALWPLFVCSAFAAGFSGVDNPTRTAFLMDIVGTRLIVQANAAWQVLFNAAVVVGPALAGVLLGSAGVATVFLVDVGTYVASVVSLVAIRHRAEPSQARRFRFDDLLGGFRYLRGHQLLQAVFVVDLNAMIFGMPSALFPALGLGHFHGGPRTVGLLYAAPGAGALVGGLLTGWLTMVRQQGRAVLLAVAVWGAAITAFGLVPVTALAVAFLALAGAADMVSAVFRSSMLQVESPDDLRGRLQAVQTGVVAGGPRLGNFEAGVVAALAGPVVSVVSGGLACLAGLALITRVMPRFAAYRTPVGSSRGDAGAGDVLGDQGGRPGLAVDGGAGGGEG